MHDEWQDTETYFLLFVWRDAIKISPKSGEILIKSVFKRYWVESGYQHAQT